MRGQHKALFQHAVIPGFFAASASLDSYAILWVALGLIAGYSLSGSTWSHNSAAVLSASGRRAIVLNAYSAGLLAGALLIALAASVVGAFLDLIPLSTTGWSVVMSLVAVPLALRHLGVVSFWMPENWRLVPENVFRFGPVVGGFQFGVEMGSGMRTYVTSSLPYILLIDATLTLSLLVCVLAAVGFAGGRALMAVLSVTSGEVTGWDMLFKSNRLWKGLALVLFLAGLGLYIAT